MVYISPCNGGWIIVDQDDVPMSAIIFPEYYQAEDYCIDRDWMICEYEAA